MFANITIPLDEKRIESSMHRMPVQGNHYQLDEKRIERMDHLVQVPNSIQTYSMKRGLKEIKHVQAESIKQIQLPR